MVKYTYDVWGNNTVTDFTDFGLGARKGPKIALDFGKYGIHGHIWKWSTHIPLIPGIVGVSELF